MPRLRGESSRARALMMSHCVPDAAGSADQARAWQLLRRAARTHGVYLTCVSGGPVHFRQWQNLVRHTEGLILEPPAAWRRLLGAALGLADRPAADRLRLGRALVESVALWTGVQSFAVVICTHPALWRAAAAAPATTHLCDLNVPASECHARAAASAGGLRRGWHRLQERRYATLEHAAAMACDLLTFADAEAAHPFLGSAQHTRIVPPARDEAGLMPLPLPAGPETAPIDAADPDSAAHNLEPAPAEIALARAA